MAGYQGFAHGAYLVATSRSWVNELVVFYWYYFKIGRRQNTKTPKKVLSLLPFLSDRIDKALRLMDHPIEYR